MSLKTVLQALIDALMKKSVANVSPGTKWSNVQITQSGQSVVSPCDGFAEISSGPKSMPNAYVSIESSQIFHQHELVTDGYYNHLHIPVKKGDPVAVYYHGLSETPHIKFISRLGGGAKSLLSLAVSWIRGGVLWLTSSTRSELGAKACLMERVPGQVLRLSRRQAIALSLQTEVQSLCTSHHPTGILPSLWAIATSLIFTQQETVLYLGKRAGDQAIALLARALYPSQKATLCITTRMLELLKCGLCNPLVLFSLNNKEVCYA